ncbi:3'(2'),5'-bisphosphate nucleotidase CysQ [Allosaccharopolyspora coralli]|uniref:3'(2'),5'-bisphosphate nucleotidase CysQ n=1 Tax=Allosaccharopolyspora coralli TaxID=2665642 RepID=A0A5Q3Q6J9_9PSEU|nr:3'(2'),5'-bisphosphate nucleotidase CysQ [Allosaccharopolyspora coralli]QGK70092.1 3'(2'),5'-bisphosphate nucleotidase CysQ [Allosaccharopolyspora coralli]
MTVDDHALAEQLAATAGRRLVELRESSGHLEPQHLREEGDRTGHELLLAELARRRPDDAVLSEHGTVGLSDQDGAGTVGRSHGRVWIIDPLDGTREFGEPGRDDWAVHVALAEGEDVVAGAVALPARDVVLSTAKPPVRLDPGTRRPQLVVSRSRPPAFLTAVADDIGADTVPMGSAGAKIASVVLGAADAYVHAGGQYEWDSAAPVAVARAAGLHTSRIDGGVLRYNRPDPWLPDLVVCRPDLAETLLRRLTEFAP